MAARDAPRRAACRRLRPAPAARLRVRAARTLVEVDAGRRARPRRSRPWRRRRATRRRRRRRGVPVVTTSVGASAASNSGPVGGHATPARRAARAAAVPRRGDRDVAHGQRGPVGERGARRRPRSPASRRAARARRRAPRRRDPLRRAVGGGDAAVEARRDLGDDERAAGAAVMQVRREVASARSLRRRRRSTSMPASRSRAKPAPGDARVGIAERDDDACDAASISASVHGGVLPWWSQGSSVTYAVAPRARSPACCSATTSACGPPGTVRSRPRRRSRRRATMTQPTAGQGAVRRRGGDAGIDRPLHQLVVAHGSLARCSDSGRPAGRGDDDEHGDAPTNGAAAENGAVRPSPIRTLTVGPGISPGRRPAGGGGVRRAVVTAGRDLHPTPRASVVSCSPQRSARPRNCNVFYFPEPRWCGAQRHNECSVET